MADITKITSPIIPRENLGSKNRPVSEQTFEINNPGRVNKPAQDKNIRDSDSGGQAMWDNLGRAAVQPILRDTGDLMLNIQKMISLIQMGISTSDVMQNEEVRELMQQIFTSPDDLLAALKQQEEASVLFRGEAFHVLRDILGKFEQNPQVKDAVIHLLKTYDYHVNTKNSIKTVLYSCENLLDFMFSKDRKQFGSYLNSLWEMLLPGELAQQAPQQEQAAQAETGGQAAADTQAAGQPLLDARGEPVLDAQGNPVMVMQDARQGAADQLSHKEMGQVLKNNLLPLLGEVVVKYHQNGRIRDMVMVVVHNIVRVDKGTPEALKDAVSALVHELRKVANLPESFERTLLEVIQQSAQGAKNAQNKVIEKLAGVISETLHHPETATPATLRQAESLLLSMLQNQSSLMQVLHFVLPMQTEDDKLFAELYVDPEAENEDEKGRPGEKTRKLFLTVSSDNHGMLEMCFLQTGERVDFSLWCPETLLRPMENTRRLVSNIMQMHGYTMTGFQVEQLVRPQSVAQVFPRLLNRKVGIDVRI